MRKERTLEVIKSVVKATLHWLMPVGPSFLFSLPAKNENEGKRKEKKFFSPFFRFL